MIKPHAHNHPMTLCFHDDEPWWECEVCDYSEAVSKQSPDPSDREEATVSCTSHEGSMFIMHKLPVRNTATDS